MAPADEVVEDGATVDEEADEAERGEKGALPLHSGVEVVVGVCLGMLVVVLLLSFEVVVDTPAVDADDDLGVVRVLAEGAIVLEIKTQSAAARPLNLNEMLLTHSPFHSPYSSSHAASPNPSQQHVVQ